MSNASQACDFAIFGVLGHLSRHKLIPSLYQLDKAGLLHENSRIIGVARRALTMCCYRIKKYTGAYLAALGGVDCVVLTGGIGENSAKE